MNDKTLIPSGIEANENRTVAIHLPVGVAAMAKHYTINDMPSPVSLSGVLVDMGTQDVYATNGIHLAHIAGAKVEPPQEGTVLIPGEVIVQAARHHKNRYGWMVARKRPGESWMIESTGAKGAKTITPFDEIDAAYPNMSQSNYLPMDTAALADSPGAYVNARYLQALCELMIERHKELSEDGQEEPIIWLGWKQDHHENAVLAKLRSGGEAVVMPCTGPAVPRGEQEEVFWSLPAIGPKPKGK